jgi:hypothetical protein
MCQEKNDCVDKNSNDYREILELVIYQGHRGEKGRGGKKAYRMGEKCQLFIR